MVNMSIFPEFGNSLDAASFAALVDELEITHKTLAERLNVDVKTISRWDNGETPVPGSVAILLQVAVAMRQFDHRWPGPEVAAPRSRRPR